VHQEEPEEFIVIGGRSARLAHRGHKEGSSQDVWGGDRNYKEFMLREHDQTCSTW
jgi:hypothetical protein